MDQEIATLKLNINQLAGIRASGRNPDDVKSRRKAEVDENREQGLVFDTDPANDKGGTSAEAKEPGAPPSESQRKK